MKMNKKKTKGIVFNKRKPKDLDTSIDTKKNQGIWYVLLSEE